MWRYWSRAIRLGRSGGFTLLEVLVAFTILAVALGALLQAFSTGLRGLGAAEAHANAVSHARSKLDEVGALIPLEEGVQSGAFDSDAFDSGAFDSGAFDEGYRWTVSIQPYEPSEAAEWGDLSVVPYDVTVTVAWGRESSVTLRTLRLAPRP